MWHINWSIQFPETNETLKCIGIRWIWQRQILCCQTKTLRLLVCITDSEVSNWSNKSDKSTNLSSPIRLGNRIKRRLQISWIKQRQMLSVINMSNNEWQINQFIHFISHRLTRPGNPIKQVVCCQCVSIQATETKLQIRRQMQRQTQDKDKYRSCVVRGWPCGQCVWAYNKLLPAPGRLLSTLKMTTYHSQHLSLSW